jgi:Helix-turn-helix domain
MASYRNGLALAAREHLASGQPLTRLEAIVLYGVSNLPDVIKELRRQGWVIKSRNVSYAAAMARLNKVAPFEAPKNLPIREIQFTEYWVSK